MGKFGCLLVILALVVLFTGVVIPVIPNTVDSPTVDSYLQSILCGADETILRSQYSERYIDGTAYSMNVYCVNNENIRRDVSGTWVLLGMAGFIIPFGIGLVMIFSTKVPPPRPVTGNGQVIDVDALRKQISTQQGVSVSGGNKSLAERLRELEEARNAGLITYNEYDRMRDEIISKK